MPIRLRGVLVSTAAVLVAVSLARAQEADEAEATRPRGEPSQQQPAPSDTRSPPRTEEPTREQVRSTYSVRRGDTLSDIAERHGVSMRELAQQNRIRNTNRIRVGRAAPGPRNEVGHERAEPRRRDPRPGGRPRDAKSATQRGSPGTGMLAYTQLADEQVWQLVLFVRSLTDGASAP